MEYTKNYILHDGIKNRRCSMKRERFCGRPLTPFNLAYIQGGGGVWWLVGEDPSVRGGGIPMLAKKLYSP